MGAGRRDEEQIFHAAVAKPASERMDYLRAACGNDSDLLAHMQALLRAHDTQDDFLEVPPTGEGVTFDRSPLTEKPGAMIGRYKLLERIGEGGMAVVYMAEQTRPIRRRVALKIIKLGMDTKSVIARFEAERQALAMMDHPNIAKVFDAGATETGRPYFVMELVTGVSVTEFCDKNSLGTQERLGLFIQVCNAVQHAHQKGIIHRDIKPSNVLVTMHDGTPVPKVIDFGIAKATKQRLTEKTLFTRYAHIIGTPAYMSPEQAELSDLDVDTRSDIYSLGVLLYELLTGTTPFGEEALRQAGYVEMQRIIREEEPVRPSTKLTTLGKTLADIAKQRGCSPDLLRKAVRGDLDWIVMKSLEKARSRRYGTASALATDVRRHLDDEPVLARAPGAAYRLEKFLRRHRTQIAALLAAVILIVSLVTALSVWYQNRRELAEAKRLRHDHVLSRAREAYARGETAGALRHVESILESEHIGPEARLLYAGILVDAHHAEAATAELEKLVHERPAIAGMAHSLWARMLLESGSRDAEKLREIEQHRAKAEELLPETAEAYFLKAMGAVAIKEKLELLNKALGRDPSHYESRRLRAFAHYASKRYADMERDAEILTVREPNDPVGHSLRGIALRELGQYDKALGSFDRAIGIMSTDDPQYAKLHDQRCETLVRMGAYSRAIAEAQARLSVSPDDVSVQFRLFCALTNLGEYNQASELFHQVEDADIDAKPRFRDWSMKYVFDTLEAGRSWHPPGPKPAGAAFVSMWEAADIYQNLIAKGARRVTTDAFTGRWAPDGRKLVFSMGVLGYSGVAVFDVNSQETDLYMVPGHYPKWSPDGQYIAFLRDAQTLRLSQYTAAERKRHLLSTRAGAEVWVMRADGTEPKRLARGRPFFWSSDSRKIYYRSEGEFYSISAEEEGAHPERVVDLPSSSPSVSPDGRKRASVRKGRLEIVEAGTESPVAQWTGPLRIYDGKWSPRGDEFSLAGPRNSEERTGLWIYNLDKKQALKVFSGHIIEANWAATGTTLAFCLGPPFYEVWGVALDPNVSTLESLGPGRTLEQHYEEMVALYTNRIDADARDAESYLHRAMYHHYLGNKTSVLADMRKYVDLCYPSDDEDSRNGWLQDLIAGLCESTPVNLGATINSPESDSPGSTSADGLRLYLHSERAGGFGKKDLYITRRASTSDPWGTPENLGNDINTEDNDFEPEISGDGLTLLFVSDRPGGLGKDDIWVARRASPDAPWGPPENPGPPINGPGLDMDPSITADGRTLYFSSDRTSGTDSCDIWVTRQASTDDPWGEPEKLGVPVNSAFWDAGPHITRDGLSLFFISLRLGGLGQTDFYVTTRPTINDPWGPSVNLGPNINTHYGDFYPKISHDGQVFMFAADRAEGIGQLDIWHVEAGSTPAGSAR